MSKLFESEKIKGMELSNRFVRSATWEGMASDDGAVTPKLIETMVALAKGGVGMIITSHAYVRQEGQAGPWQIGDRRKALCKSDNACFKPGMEGKGIYCLTAEVEQGKLEA